MNLMKFTNKTSIAKSSPVPHLAARAFILLLLLFPFYCLANPLTLSELIDTALQNNPKTRQAWWNAKRATASLGNAKSAYYPTLALNTNISHGRDYKYINGPDTTYTNIQADLALSLMLYDFGVRKADVNSAKMALTAAGWQADLTLQKVIVEVLENAYLFIHEEEVLQASLLSLDEARRMIEVSDKLYHAGLNPISDVYTSKSTLSLMQIEVARRKSTLDIQRGKLAVSLGLSIGSSIELMPIPIPQNEKQALDDLLELAENQRADLMEKRARLMESAYSEDKAKAFYKPKLSLGARGGYDQYVKDKDRGAHYQIILNFDVPLFNGFKSFYQIKEAIANTQIREEEVAELELSIALEVLTYSRTLESALEMLFYATENLENAKKAYDGTFDKYEIGEESIAELSIAQKQLSSARILFSDIKTRLLVSIANLSYATGSLCIE